MSWAGGEAVLGNGLETGICVLATCKVEIFLKSPKTQVSGRLCANSQMYLYICALLEIHLQTAMLHNGHWSGEPKILRDRQKGLDEKSGSSQQLLVDTCLVGSPSLA